MFITKSGHLPCLWSRHLFGEFLGIKLVILGETKFTKSSKW